MQTTHAAPPDVALPASVFASLRRELSREVGPVATLHALQAAGHAAGTAAAPGLVGSAETDAGSMAGDVFWARLSSSLARRGWGRLTHRSPHDGVGLLESPDWVEAGEAGSAGGEGAAGCAFSAGYLSGLLTEIAGGPVAVLEVSCRGRGDDACAFAFGSETVIHRLYGDLVDGEDLSSALASL